MQSSHESRIWKNQTLKLKRKVSLCHFDVTELALHAQLQEQFPKGHKLQDY